MPSQATIVRVLLGSPGDARGDCEAIERAIHLWNSGNSQLRGIMFQPVRWDVDAMPELGADPQSIINKQLVDGCDMIIGVFSTRLGTATPRAVSGTAEEISRFVDSGRLAMIYLSQKNMPRRGFDVEQFTALEQFKGQLKSKGIVFEFDTDEGLLNQVILHLGRAAERFGSHQGASASQPALKPAANIQPILDRVEAESSQLSGGENAVDADADLGILDHAENSMRAVQQLLAAVTRITERTHSVGISLQGHAARINALKVAKGNDIPASESKVLVNAAATDIEQFALGVANDTKEMGSNYADYANGIRALLSLLGDSAISPEHASELEELLEVTTGVPKMLQVLRDNVMSFRSSIASMPRMTARLNDSRKKSVAALTQFDDEIDAMIRLTMELETAIKTTLEARVKDEA